jgi:cell division protease FtsH
MSRRGPLLEKIDIAVREIVDKVYAKTLEILAREKKLLEAWAQRLLEKETLAEPELDELKARINGVGQTQNEVLARPT